MDTLDAAAARAIAEREMKTSKYDLVVVEEQERASGWVFYVSPRAYAETGDRQYLVPGLGPIFVSRWGEMQRVPTFDPEGFIDRLDREWTRTARERPTN